MIKKIIKILLKKVGYDLIKLKEFKKSDSVFSTYSDSDQLITDIEKLAYRGAQIPGMIDPRSGQMLYTLCYMQQLHGDVVEIGSWQGRSTSFLGNAVKDSKNGHLFAIDHFKGNIGKENFYTVDGTLQGLSDKFLMNVSDVGLSDDVSLLDMSSNEAAEKLNDTKIRFLFVDGDHTYEGVKNDIELFFPKLIKGAVVVFDDYFEGFPGLIKAVDELVINSGVCSKVFYYQHTLVVEVN